MRTLLLGGALSAALAVGVAALPSGGTATADVLPSASVTSTPVGLVHADGTTLRTADGKPFRFLGFQAGLGASPAHPRCSAYADDEVRSTMDEAVADKATVLRVWMFQEYGGPQDWTRYDLLVREARARGLRILATLTNNWGDCEAEKVVGTPLRKTLGWYQSGYRVAGDGNPLPYRDYVAAMAAHFRNEPAILGWQLVNEADTSTADGSCDESSGRQALRAFADDMVGVVRATGDSHLVSLGLMGSGQCGASGSDGYRFVEGGKLDLCDYHDYSPLAALPGDAWNGLAVRVSDCAALGKPIMIDEEGISRGVQADGSDGPVTAATVARRADLFDAKLTAQLAAGISGVILWQKTNNLADPFRVPTDDPVNAVVAAHAALLPVTRSDAMSSGAVVPTVLASQRSGLHGPAYRTDVVLAGAAQAVRLSVSVPNPTLVAVRSATGRVLWQTRLTGARTLTLRLPAAAHDVILDAARPTAYVLRAVTV